MILPALPRGSIVVPSARTWFLFSVPRSESATPYLRVWN